MRQCVQCPDGSWVCGDNPECPIIPGDPRELVASLGTIQFEIELWSDPSRDPPFMVRLKPVVDGA